MRFKAVVICFILALLWLTITGNNKPDEAPIPPGELDLSGAFIGEQAAEDAAKVAALAGELADAIEWDSMQDTPVLKTGVTLDALRSKAREFRCDGRSIGQANPEVAKRVGAYLDKKLGNAGGPVTDEQTERWVAAYREIERAARRVLE
tara:strand:- start:112 stop:558 length:447 start_codon:yes stop_codon:yes gene_type:complete